MENTLETIIKIAALVGLGAILKDVLARVFKKSDDRETVHVANQARAIDQEDKFQERVLNRLERVENELREVQEKLTTQLVMNAKIEGENTNLKEKEKQAEKEIKELKETNNKQAIKIINLESQVNILETTMLIQKDQFDQLKTDFNNLQYKNK